MKMETINNEFLIDAVITWVDGNDNNHQQKMNKYLDDSKNINSKTFRTRFDQVNEIEFAVKSIIKFAPYIKNIFIVTDNQIPPFLENYNKQKVDSQPTITVVDHKVIFSEFNSLLPVFNCRPIETLVYKIPSLSEHFIYFNDDFSLLKKTTPSDFFVDGFPVLRGEWKPLDENIFHKKVINGVLRLFGKESRDKKYGYKRGQQNAARALGFDSYFKLDHTPAPIRKSSLKNYFQSHLEMQDRNIRHRFRNPEQYVLQSLANHIEIKKGSALLKEDYQLIYIGGSHKKPLYWYRKMMHKAVNDDSKLFLCMQSLDLCPKNRLDLLFGWLQKRLNIDNLSF
jgi:hypothetical protein